MTERRLASASAPGALTAELLGTFGYVWIGTATVMSTASGFGPSATAISEKATRELEGAAR